MPRASSPACGCRGVCPSATEENPRLMATAIPKTTRVRIGADPNRIGFARVRRLPRSLPCSRVAITVRVASSFSASWLRGDPRALEFLPDHFRHRSARAEAVGAAASRTVAPALHAALVARHARLAPSPSRERNLELLARPGTTVVVTGQQVGLFLGPLFTIYKAASAIVAARALAEETGRPCVPVFWLQTEDHDLPEIDHTFIPSAAGALLRVALGVPDAAHSRTPVAHRRLGASVTGALATLRAQLGGQSHADEHLALLERAYRPEAAMADAFAEVLSTLFADEGLVFLDPRDPRLAPLSAPLHRRAIEEATAIANGLAERGCALGAAGVFDHG